MAGRLGILVNSDRYPQYVLELCRAAQMRGRQVSVHFTGAGLPLADGPLVEALEGLAHISQEPTASGISGPAGVPCIALSEFLLRCDRTVVF